MPNTKDLVPSSLIQSAIMGKSGRGKSWFSYTFPRPNIINFDNKMDVVKHPEFRKKYGDLSIEYQFFRERTVNNRAVVTAHNAFDDACRYFDDWMKPGKRDQFDTWIVDSGTTLSDAAMNKAIILLGTNEFKKMSQTHNQAVSTGLVFPKKQDYGAERSMLEQFVRMVRDSGKHFLFIVHEKEIQDDAGNLVSVVPLLTGGSSEVVSGMFDNVWSITTKLSGFNLQRVLLTENDGIRNNKCPWGIGNIIDPDYAKLKAAIEKAQAAVPANQSGITPSGVSPSTLASATK